MIGYRVVPDIFIDDGGQFKREALCTRTSTTKFLGKEMCREVDIEVDEGIYRSGRDYRWDWVPSSKVANLSNYSNFLIFIRVLIQIYMTC